jgi:uroporphyrinogen-III synthase
MKSSSILLVTRAGSPGASLAERLQSDGWPARHCPSIDLVGPVDPDACAARLAAMLPADRIILTSPEGARQAVALIGADAFAAIPVVVPGPGTAAVARKLGLARVVGPARSGDSEAMLALPELEAVEGMRILILAAAGGRLLLETELRRRGARVERLHVYRRLPAGLPEALVNDISSATQVITLISSGGALEALQAGLPESAWKGVLAGFMLVPSERVAGMARQAGARHVVNAQGADDESFCRALRAATSPGQLR